MSIFGIGRQPGQARYNGHVSNLSVTEAVLGTTLTLLFGTHRLHGKLLDYYGFNAQKQSAPTGKGIFGSKGDFWEYYATVVIALAQGPCQALLNVWNYNGILENLSTFYSYTVPPGGGSIAPVSGVTAPIQFDLGVTQTQSYIVSTNDYGGSPATLSGTQQIPLVKVPSSPGAGQYSFDATTGTYTFGSAMAGAVLGISYSSMFSLYYLVQTQFDLVPFSTPYQITPDNHDYFYQDLGVTFIDTNTAGVLVSGTPAAPGEYHVDIGFYNFYSGDQGRPVAIKYSFTSSDSNITSTSVLNLTFFNGAKSQAPWAYTESANPSHALGYTGICYVASENLDLGQTAQTPPYNYEVAGLAIQPGTQDCNLADVNEVLLCDPLCGIEFPTSALDISQLGNGGTSGYSTASDVPSTTVGGGIGMTFDLVASGGVISAGAINRYGSGYKTGDKVYPTQGGSSGDAYFIVGTWCMARAHWNANGFYISDAIESAGGLSDTLKRYHDAGNTAAFLSGGLLKLVPYSEVSAVGNGSTYIPPTTPIATLGWDQILLPGSQKPGNSLSDDFIATDVKAAVDKYNYVQANWSDRLNSYNNDLLNLQSDAAIALYKRRMESAQDWTFVCIRGAIQWALSCRLARMLYVDKKITFSLPFTLDFLEPMDVLVTPTGIAVRITKIEESETQELAIEAENFVFAGSSASIYPSQIPDRYQPKQNAADPGSTYPAFIQRTTQQTGGILYQLSVAAAGTSKNWGGCQIWVSVDGVNYSLVGSINEICSIGILSAALSAVANPDTTAATLSVAGTSGYTSANSLPTTTSGSGVGLLVNIIATAGVIQSGSVDSGNQGSGYLVGDKIYPTQAGSSGDAYFTITQIGEILAVDMSPSGGKLIATSQGAADQFATLAALISTDGLTSEFISFQNCELTAANRYNLSYLRRGVDGTVPAAFALGAVFAYIGSQPLFQYQFTAARIGQPLFVKLASFNLTGQAIQPLSQCKAYELFLTAQGSAPIGGIMSPSAFSDTGGNPVSNPTDAYDGNVTSFAQGTGSNSIGDAAIEYSGFPSFVTDGSQNLFISYRLQVLGAGAPGAYFTTTVGGGVFWNTPGATAATATIPIPAGTNISSILVDFFANSLGFGTGQFRVYEIWIQ